MEKKTFSTIHNIVQAEYDVESQKLYITFKNHSKYEYRDVPERIWDEIQDCHESDGMGSIFYGKIKNVYSYILIK